MLASSVRLLGLFSGLLLCCGVSAEQVVCSSSYGGNGDWYVYQDGCPTYYYYVGTLSDVRNGLVPKYNVRFSESLFEQIREFGKEGQEQRNQRLTDNLNRVFNSLDSGLEAIRENRKSKTEIKAELTRYVPDLPQVLKDRKFKKWVKASKERRQLLKDLKRYDESSIVALAQLYPPYVIEQTVDNYGEPTRIQVGAKYYGEINQEGRSHGRGLIAFNSGISCFGTFDDNRLGGSGGCMFSKSGNFYLGQLSDSQLTGEGMYFYGSTGTLTTGTFTKGILAGKGTAKYKSGNSYTGEFFENKRSGFGTYLYASGNKYVGGWKEGKRHGSGTIHRTDGWTNVVHYEEGKREGKTLLMNGDSLVIVANYVAGKCSDVSYITSQVNAQVAGRLNCKKQIPVSSF